MLESYLIKGLLVGIVFGVPAGAIGALTLQRSLSYGFFAGFVTGFGSTFADLIYACIGVFGLTIISDFLLQYQVAIGIVGGVFIMILGIIIFAKKTLPVVDDSKKVNYFKFFIASFIVAITNPATILAFFVAFSSFEIAANPTLSNSLLLLLGILLGTCCWWGGLSFLVCTFSQRVTNLIYQRLNKALGTLMLIFGLLVILT